MKVPSIYFPIMTYMERKQATICLYRGYTNPTRKMQHSPFPLPYHTFYCTIRIQRRSIYALTMTMQDKRQQMHCFCSYHQNMRFCWNCPRAARTTTTNFSLKEDYRKPSKPESHKITTRRKLRNESFFCLCQCPRL